MESNVKMKMENLIFYVLIALSTFQTLLILQMVCHKTGSVQTGKGGTAMTDRENVIKGLECHQIDNKHRINCADCPYYVDDDNHVRCVNDLHDDAIALLKEQETSNLYKCPNCGTWVSARNVVRCKDCKHYDHTRLYKCRIHGSMFQPKDENWFCADGEVKRDG